MKRTLSTAPPPLDQATIEWLDTIFPDRCPKPSETDRQIWMASGARGVIEKMRAVLAAQTRRVHS
jgi:hypothetical protein